MKTEISRTIFIKTLNIKLRKLPSGSLLTCAPTHEQADSYRNFNKRSAEMEMKEGSSVRGHVIQTHAQKQNSCGSAAW